MSESAGASLPTRDSVRAHARAAVGAIGKRARATNFARAYEIQATVMNAASGQVISEAGREGAIRAAHQISGSSGTFGMLRASALAKDLQVLLEEADLRFPVQLMPVIGALDALLRELTAEGSEQHPAGRELAVARHRMLIAHADAAVASRITGTARGRGWETRWAFDVASATAELAEMVPDVVLLDLDLPPAGSSVLAETAGHEPPIPTIVLAHADDVLDRVEASRAGATSFVDAGLDPERIVAAAAHIAMRPGTKQRRLLAVDDDPLILEYLREVFRNSSLEISTLTDPLRFWERLKETQPDLVLLDVDMPGITGLELCRLIRADAQWAELPVLVLTGTVHPTNVTSLFAAGADDYVSKPVVGPELVARIRNRLDRVQLHRRMADTDPLTGIRNRSAFEAAFTGLVERSGLVGQPLTLAMVDIDDFRQVNTEHGYDVGDQVVLRLAGLLEGSFHGEDVVARWSGTEFVVAMLGLHRTDGVARVAELLEAFRSETFGTRRELPIRATLSGAVGELGADGPDLLGLLRSVGHAMGVAKNAGGDRILPVGWAPATEGQAVDVLHISADDSLAAQLQRSLRTRGLHGRHVALGSAGLLRLIGPDRVRARVVLLDDDPPELDAMSALARLGSEGVLDRTRVIVLSERTGRSDVVAMQSMGAFDHVAKPVSVPLLVRRIRRALVR